MSEPAETPDGSKHTDGGVAVRVLYDFEYRNDSGANVWMREGEKLFLLRKTNVDWWQVIRRGEKRSFFAPATYMEEMETTGSKMDAANNNNNNERTSLSAAVSNVTVMNRVLSELRTEQQRRDGQLTTFKPTCDESGNYCTVAPMPGNVRDTKNSLTKQLSSSLEEMAQQITFPVAGPSKKVKPVPLPRQRLPDKPTQHHHHHHHHQQQQSPLNFSNPACGLSRSSLSSDDDVLATSSSAEELLDVPATSPLPAPRVAAPPPSASPPIYANVSLLVNQTTPSPSESITPADSRLLRHLFDGWSEYLLPDETRSFYYNEETGEKRWKPPRRRTAPVTTTAVQTTVATTTSTPSPQFSRSEQLISRHASWLSLAEEEEVEQVTQPLPSSSGSPLPTPPCGWSMRKDDKSGFTCYIHERSGAKWFASHDPTGRVYYFDEKSNESTWALPQFDANSKTESPKYVQNLLNPKTLFGSKTSPLTQTRFMKAQSLVMESIKSSGDDVSLLSVKSNSMPRDVSPHNSKRTLEPDDKPVRAGTIWRSRLTEGGKKLRKNWAAVYAVVINSRLLIFRDQRLYIQWETSRGSSPKSELDIDLTTSTLEWVHDKSSRKNVFQLDNAKDALQLLLQVEDDELSRQWFTDISRYTVYPAIKTSEEQTPPSGGVFTRITRTRSTKAKPSTEDIERTKIKAKLKKFFHKRPTVESLVNKGIYRDEPVFGRHLDELCHDVPSPDGFLVPAFVRKCINAIESEPENMMADGLYRASGNLSQVQRIRLQVDHDRWSLLENGVGSSSGEERDVHVLTGCLKLFFRELKEPLIPYDVYSAALAASEEPSRAEKVKKYREIVKNMPKPNRDTLLFLLKHLLRVTEYQASNRMHVPNLAIVFGPTLMWPQPTPLANAASANKMALDVMQQNLVIEALLMDVDDIFN